jgi:hypothetical protein
MTFTDITNQIEEALIQGQYSKETIQNWNEKYSNGEFTDHWQGYVIDLFELQSFLSSCVIFNGTHDLVIIHATQLALNNQK